MATGFLEGEDRHGKKGKVFSQQSHCKTTMKKYKKVTNPPHDPSHLTTAIHPERATQLPPLA